MSVKGDWNRVTNKKQFDNNFDQIKWGENEDNLSTMQKGNELESNEKPTKPCCVSEEANEQESV